MAGKDRSLEVANVGLMIFPNLIFLHGNGGTIGAGATMSFIPGLQGLVATANNAIIDKDAVVRNLFVRIGGTQPASGSLVATFMINSVASALAVTIPAGSTTGNFSDLVNSARLVSGDTFRVDVKNNASGVSVVLGACVFEFDF